MRILVDTNILFSAILFPNSKPAKALLRVATRHEMILCSQNILELQEILVRKAPRYLTAAQELLDTLTYTLIDAIDDEPVRIRDASDQPILNAAITHDVDIILTGDKDFLTLDLARPQCMTAAEFLAQKYD